MSKQASAGAQESIAGPTGRAASHYILEAGGGAALLRQG